MFTLTLAAVVGCGLMAGLFFAFSVSIMVALAQLAPEAGMTAMQTINVSIVNPVFLVVFIGTALVCIAALVLALTQLNTLSARYLLGGSICYLAGALLVTALINIPMNNALAAVKATDPASAGLWATYLSTWTAWNHVRAGASLIATVCFTLALYHSAQA